MVIFRNRRTRMPSTKTMGLAIEVEDKVGVRGMAGNGKRSA